MASTSRPPGHPETLDFFGQMKDAVTEATTHLQTRPGWRRPASRLPVTLAETQAYAAPWAIGLRLEQG